MQKLSEVHIDVFTANDGRDLEMLILVQCAAELERLAVARPELRELLASSGDCCSGAAEGAVLEGRCLGLGLGDLLRRGDGDGVLGGS